MEKRFINPHTFDMNHYYTGQMFVVGGRDFDQEENEYVSKIVPKVTSEKKIPIKLDWSFLKDTKNKK